EGATLIDSMIESALNRDTGLVATLIGLGTLLVGASGVFAQLQGALNQVWGVRPNPKKGLLVVLRARVPSFAMILAVGFLLLVSLIVSAWLSSLFELIAYYIPDAQILLRVLNFIFSFAAVTVLFALIYKVLPDVKIRWRDVWLGAAGTALLFGLGKY